MMEKSLEDGEFQIYLQPKYMTENEKIGGAEALVRWISKSEGMIYPDAFIPLFEKNGFIVNIDLCVFENVCMTLQRWVYLFCYIPILRSILQFCLLMNLDAGL